MIVALDLETTGLDPQKDRIIEVAAIRINKNGEIVGEFQSLVNPGIPVPSLIQSLTGITPEELDQAPRFEEIQNQILAFIGESPILGHSVQFDVNFLKSHGVHLSQNKILDTCQLAQTFLPRETSYSLEILSEKYGLVHDNKHRALDDTRVAIELYQLLMETFSNFSENLKTKIRKVIEKSDWEWKEILSEKSSLEFDSKRITNKIDSHGLARGPYFNAFHRGNLSSEHSKPLPIETSWNKNTPTLIESLDYSLEELISAVVDCAEKSGEYGLIATPHLERVEADPRVTSLKHPREYLCQKKWKRFIEKKAFTSLEVGLAIKGLIWLETTQNGEKNEIRFTEKEQKMWPHLSAWHHLYWEECEEECFYKKAFRKAATSLVTVIDHRLLAEDSLKKGKLIPAHRHLIIDQIEDLESHIVQAWTRRFSLDQFLSHFETTDHPLITRLEIIFGLLGILAQKYSDANPFGDQVILTEMILSSPEGKNLQASLKSVEGELNQEDSPESELALLSKEWKVFTKALTAEPTHVTWITVNREGNPWVECCPKQIDVLLAQNLWRQHAQWIGFSRLGKLNENFDIMKEKLGIPETTLEESLPPLKPHKQITAFFYPDIPGIYTENNEEETLKLLEKILERDTSESKKTFLLMNSQRSIEQMTNHLERFKNKGVKTFVQGENGGIGKIGELFKKSEGKTILIGSEKMFHGILRLKEPSLHQLLIHRFPFAPPSHPLEKERCSKYKNSFMEYSLPNALLKFKKLIWEFIQAEEAEEVHILDPRGEQYDGVFKKSLVTLFINLEI